MSAIEGVDTKLRPSGWWYLLVPLLLVAGFGFGVAEGVDAVIDFREQLELVEPDEAMKLELEAGEQVTVWAVWRDGRDSDGMEQHPLFARIRGPEGDVRFRPVGMSFRQTLVLGSTSMLKAGSFAATEDGTHQVRMAFLDASESGEPIVGLSTFSLFDRARGVLVPILAGLASSLAVLVVLLVLRRRSKRRIERLVAGSALDGRDAAGTTPARGPISFE